MKTDDIPRTWPNHFDEAIRILSWRLLPALKFSPKELLLGLVVNTKPTNIAQSTTPVSEADITTQMAYVAQQCLDGYAEAVAHALRRKRAFDRRVFAQNLGEVTFSKGQLIQIYRSDLDYTFKMERKLLPKWSIPQCIASWNLNSYVLETMKGDPIPGLFSARQLRQFTPKTGTKLAKEQALVEARCALEEKEGEKEEERTITEERAADTTSSPNHGAKPPETTPNHRRIGGEDQHQ